jgi:hypothetical protein
MAKNMVLDIIIGLKDKTSDGLKTIGGNLKSFGDGVKSAFNSAPVRMFRNAIVAVSAALVGAVVEAANFNIQIARVSTMGGKNFKALREDARALASDFGIARSEVAKGMYNALSAGVDKNNLESFMRTAAKVAVADGSDISIAVDGITTVLNAFKVSAADAEKVTDDLFQTVRQGKTTFGDLAANLATVAPIAAASEIPLKQILAHVAALTAQGTPTAQAMTQIRASIIGLNKALGDGWSSTMSYQDALKKVWQNAGQSQTKLLELVGSSEAVQAVLGGVGINAQMAADKLNAMKDSAGSAQEAFKKVDEFRHWPTLIETARGTLSKLGEEIDSRLHPYVVAITEQIRQWRDDSGLWDKIGKFLDRAEERLHQIAEWVSNIKSLDDLKTAGLELGKKFTDFVMERAGEIGAAMAAGVWNGIKNGVSSTVNSQVERGGNALANFITGGDFQKRVDATAGGSYAVGSPEWKQNYSDIKAGTNITHEAISTAVKDGVLAAIQQSPQDSTDSERLLTALEGGLSGEALDKLLVGLELTSEDLELLAEYTESLNTSSQDTVEATTTASEKAKEASDSATKAAEAAVDSNSKVTAAMDRSKDASLAAAQAAQRNIAISEQSLAVIASLSGSLARLEQNVSFLQGQVNSMRT